MYFLHAFFHRSCRGLGRVLGEVWDLLGVSWGTLKRLFSRLCCQEGPRGGQEVSRVRFSMVWDRFREGCGRPKSSKNHYFFVIFDINFRHLILVEWLARIARVSLLELINVWSVIGVRDGREIFFFKCSFDPPYLDKQRRDVDI